MKIKHSEKVISKANNLLRMNYEAEKMYTDAYNIVKEDDLKYFFRELALEKGKFIKALQKETVYLSDKLESFEGLNKLSRTYYIFWKNLRPLLKENNTPELIDQICNINEWSIVNYNDLLQEFNLSLSLCKLLVEQRDLLQYKINTLKVREALEV
jgi:hypothetical protein